MIDFKVSSSPSPIFSSKTDWETDEELVNNDSIEVPKLKRKGCASGQAGCKKVGKVRHKYAKTSTPTKTLNNEEIEYTTNADMDTEIEVQMQQ